MPLLPVLFLLACGAFASSAAAARSPEIAATPSIKELVALYHQNRFESALAGLETLHSNGLQTRRDSLSVYQYLGMASARLGHEKEAVWHFKGLLGLDSLFQFPSNEDLLVVKAFQRAGEERKAEAAAESASSAHSAAMTSLMDTTRASRPDKISVADSGASALSRTGSEQDGRRISFAYGAIPLGAGWLARRKTAHGLALGILQAGGIALSIYASGKASNVAYDADGIRNKDQLDADQQWQLVQRISLSTALGSYLFSLIASSGD